VTVRRERALKDLDIDFGMRAGDGSETEHCARVTECAMLSDK
jgi:hypothetical protein